MASEGSTYLTLTTMKYVLTAMMLYDMLNLQSVISIMFLYFLLRIPTYLTVSGEIASPHGYST